MLKINLLLYFVIASFAQGVNASDITFSQHNDTEFSYQIEGATIDIEIPSTLIQHKKNLLHWLEQSVQTVTQYYDQFPVKTVTIRLVETEGNKVTFGQAFGGIKPFIRVVVGRDITLDNLNRDWVLTHELVHLAMANVNRPHAWLLEGLATYIESVSRAQSGLISEEFVWRGFIKSFPQGLPKANDKGLDHTPTWGRKYWGGAIFFLLADIEIRQLTNNQYNIKDALKGVLKKGLSMHKRTTPEVIFNTADKTVGVPAFMPLYNKMKATAYPIDLDALWSSLGISLQNNNIIYDDSAPLVTLRSQMLKTKQ